MGVEWRAKGPSKQNETGGRSDLRNFDPLSIGAGSLSGLRSRPHQIVRKRIVRARHVVPQAHQRLFQAKKPQWSKYSTGAGMERSAKAIL
jgi:hypothetical protein